MSFSEPAPPTQLSIVKNAEAIDGQNSFTTNATVLCSVIAMSDKPQTKTKTFGKSTREVPTQKAKKYYPAEDEQTPKKVRTSGILTLIRRFEERVFSTVLDNISTTNIGAGSFCRMHSINVLVDCAHIHETQLT